MSETDFDFSGAMGAEVAKDSNKGGTFAREVEYLSLDASQSGIAQGKHQMLLRPLTDNVRRDANAQTTKFNLPWITVDQHYSQTKPRPEYAREGANWPQKMGAGCRADKVFAAKYPGGCMFCQRGEKASSRSWALAVEREEVRNEQGQVLGYRDKTREVFDTDANGELIVLSQDGDKKTYQMKTVPAFVVINQGWKNFFNPWHSSASYFDNGNVSGLLSGDWVVTRSGTGNNDTSYTFIRVAEQTIPDENPFGVPGGTKYDLAIPGLMEKVYPNMPDLRRLIADRISDDYLGRFFVPGWMPEGFDPNKPKGGQQQSSGATGGFMMNSAPAPQTPNTAPTEEPPSDALAALKSRVTQGAGTAPAQQ